MHKPKNPPISAEQLRAMLHYDPETGLFTWLVDAFSHKMAGKRAGGRQGPYFAIGLNRRVCKAHRVAWCYMTGAWPVGEIDHINGDKLDNRFVNLREASRHVNAQNVRRPLATRKYDLPLGVSRRSRPTIARPFVARLRINGREVHLGSFASPAEAHQAYLAAKRQHHPGCSL